MLCACLIAQVSKFILFIDVLKLNDYFKRYQVQSGYTKKAIVVSVSVISYIYYYTRVCCPQSFWSFCRHQLSLYAHASKLLKMFGHDLDMLNLCFVYSIFRL